ncbi:UNVERIFIED_ORG: tape measure domain-containing protein [Rhodococcus erythropolis]
MATIGTAVLEIIPSARGMGGKIATGFGGEFTAAGRAAGVQMGQAVADGVSSAKSAVDKAMAQLMSAQTKQADAAGKVVVAQQKLQELQESGKAKASQLTAATNNLATAQNKSREAVANTARADQNLASAKDRLKRATDTSSSSQAQHATAVARNNAAVRDMGGAVSSGAEKMKKLALAAAGAVAAYAGFRGLKSLVGDTIAAGTARLDTIESSTASLTVTLGDAGKAASFMNEVLATVKGTPFNLDQFAKAGSSLVSMGAAAEKVPGYLTAIGNVAAGKGNEADEYVDRIGDAFGKVATMGKIAGTEILSLSKAGVPAMRIMANEMGITTDEMQKLVSDGAVPAEKALDMLTKGIMEGTNGIAGETPKLGGQMEALNATFRGAAGGMSAARARLGAEVLKPLRAEFIHVFGAAGDAMDAIAPKAAALSQRFVDTGVIKKFGESIASLPANLEQWGGQVSKMWKGFKDSDVAQDSLVKLGMVFESLGKTAKPLKEAVQGIAGSLAKASAATGVSAWVVMLDVMTAVGPILDTTVVPALQLTSTLMNENQGVVTALVLAYAAFKTIPSIMGRIAPSVASMNATLATSDGRLTRYQSAILATRNAATNAATGMRGFGTEVRSTQAFAAAAGRPIGTLGASFLTLGQHVGGARGALSGIKSVASGAMGALGGPFGIALLAAGAGLALFARKQAEAKKEAQEHEQAIKDLTGTLDQHTGAVTEQTYIVKAKELAESKAIESARNYGIAEKDLVGAHLNNADALGRVNTVLQENLTKSIESSDIYKDAGDNWQRAGVSAKDLAEALSGVPGKYDEVKDKLFAYNTASRQAGTSGQMHVESLGAVRKGLDDVGRGAADLGEKLGDSNEELKVAQQRAVDAAAAMEKGRTPASQFGTALQTLGGMAGSAEDKLSALQDALTVFNGGTVNLEKIESQLAATADATRDAFAAGAGATGLVDGAAGREFDKTSEAGRRLIEVSVAQAEQTHRNAQAAYTAKKNIGDLAGAQADAAAVVAASRQRYIDAAAVMGIVGKEAEDLATKYFGIPEVVATLLSLDIGQAVLNAEESARVLELLGQMEPSPQVDLIRKKLEDGVALTTQDLAALAKIETKPEVLLEIADVFTKSEAARRELAGIKDKTVTVTIDAVRTPAAQNEYAGRQEAIRAGVAAPQQLFAHGGAAYGGTPGKDSIPALLMPGEHVLDTEDVRLMGGQAGVYRFRDALAQGKVEKFAVGGAVGSSWFDRVRNYFAPRTGNPYLWAGTGPDRFDCSGAVGGAQQVAFGASAPNGRVGTTHTALDGSWPHIVRGASQSDLFVLGVNRDHMVAKINGHRLESGGQSNSLQWDGYADDAFNSKFTQFHIPNEMLGPVGSGTSLSGGGSGVSGLGSKRKAEWTEKDDIALDSARIAIQQAIEAKERIDANPKKSPADSAQAETKIRKARERVTSLEKKRDAAAAGMDAPPPPPAPELTSSWSDDEIDMISAQLAVEEADARRNEVYDDEEATDKDRLDADLALQRAINARKAKIEGEKSGNSNGRLMTPEELGGEMGKLAVRGLFEFFGLENSTLADPSEFLGINSGDNVRTSDPLPARSARVPADSDELTTPQVHVPTISITREQAMSQMPITLDPNKGIEQLLALPGAKLFDQGGMLDGIGVNLSGKPEPVLTNDEYHEWRSSNRDVAAMVKALKGSERASSGRSGGPLIGEMHNHGPDARAVMREMDLKLEARMGTYVGRA